MRSKAGARRTNAVTAGFVLVVGFAALLAGCGAAEPSPPPAVATPVPDLSSAGRALSGALPGDGTMSAAEAARLLRQVAAARGPESLHEDPLEAREDVEAAWAAPRHDDAGLVFEALWGDRSVAVRQMASLDPGHRCSVEMGLARRAEREGDDVTQWLAAAEASSSAVSPDSYYACFEDLVRLSARVGDRPRVIRLLGRAHGWSNGVLCMSSWFVDHVDPELLEGLVRTADARGDELGEGRWGGCYLRFAEIAARRGDRRLAGLFLQRELRFDGTEDDVTRQMRRDEIWAMGVRLGRVDPFAPHALGGARRRLLLVARILEDGVFERIDAARVRAAIEPGPPPAEPRSRP